MMHMRVSPETVVEQPSRYRGSLSHPVALGLAVLVHLGLLALLLTLGVSVTRAPPPAPALVVHDVRLDTPPPAKEEPKRPVPNPPPVMHVPRPPVLQPISSAPAIMTTPEPQPVAPAPVAEAPPAPSPPPPAAPAAGGDLSSTMIHAPAPRYPHESRRKREQGTVLLSVLLAQDGTVAEIRVARSSGYPRLDEAARNAVKRWRWSPTMRGGVAVQVRGTVEIPFILTG